jgi:drug/metabolite transporter, DME family
MSSTDPQGQLHRFTHALHAMFAFGHSKKHMWAVVAGVGFGVFQSINRRAVGGIDVSQATFLQLLISAMVLAAISLATQDLHLLRTAPPGALIHFSLAGLMHFFVGWTFLNASQKRIGASRTSPLLATNPLFAALIAMLTWREFPNLSAWVGMLSIIAGVYCISNGSGNAGGRAQAAPAMPGRNVLFGLSAACCWAISPIFTRKGLAGLPSPLLGVTVGLTASVLAYGLALLFQHRLSPIVAIPHDALFFKTVAGILAGVSTWNRWIALDLAPVAVVLALALTSVPVVMLLSPLVTDRTLEQATSRVWLGAALVGGGVLLLIFNH